MHFIIYLTVSNLQNYKISNVQCVDKFIDFLFSSFLPGKPYFFDLSEIVQGLNDHDW